MNTKRPGLSKTALATAAIALAGLSTHAQAQSVALNSYLASSARNSSYHSDEDTNSGFRVDSLAAPSPEPSTYGIVGGIALIHRRKAN